MEEGVGLLKHALMFIIRNCQGSRDLIWVPIVESWPLTPFRDLSSLTDLEPFDAAPSIY